MVNYQVFKTLWITFNKLVNFNYDADDTEKW